MVQSMYEMQPERFGTALTTQDILNMTPLHRAALFDHVTVVEFLVKLVNIGHIVIKLKVLVVIYDIHPKSCFYCCKIQACIMT